MSHQDTRKKVLAKRLGVSERVLEQYLELKHAEANEGAAQEPTLSRRDDMSGASLSNATCERAAGGSTGRR